MEWYDVNNLVHASFGFAALLGGVVALATVKGSFWHVRGGQLFVLMMIAVLVTAAITMTHRFLPLAIFMILAEVYLIPSGLLSVGRGRESRIAWNWPLMGLAVLLALLTAIQFVRLNLLRDGIVIGPAALSFMFVFLAFQDWVLLRRTVRHPNFWLRRHLTRMILAFTFGVMALVRIGLNFGLTLEMATVGPLLIAAISVIWVYRRYPVVAPAATGT
jgi:hypothetical protein